MDGNGNRVLTDLPARYEAAMNALRLHEARIEAAIVLIALRLPDSDVKSRLIKTLNGSYDGSL